MINRIAFQNRLNTYNLFKQVNPFQLRGCMAIIDEFENRKDLTDNRWLAYMLATTYHETARTMEPIEEYGKGRGRKYGQKIKQSGKPYNTPDQLYYGRGFVQLTWYENYERFGKLLKINLLEEPYLAMRAEISTKILFEGMIHGLFTGKKLSHYLNADKSDFIGARKIINGTDKAELIAKYAERFLNCIDS